jgi:alpha/beta superfamily hydrolase
MPRDALLAGRIGVRGDVVKALPLSGALEVLLAALASPMSAAQAPTSPVADREETIHFPMGGEMGEVHLAYDNGVDGSRLLVVFPPHPLFGGDADSSVVRAIVRGGVDAGYVTARCNYRGVTAGGFRDDDAHRAWLGWEARRDYAAVRDDAVALLDELHRRFPCAERLVLAGYSFGAVAALMTLAESTVVVRRVMLVSPPLGGHDFDALIAGKGAVPLHILAPTLDPFCSAIDLSSLAARHGVELRLLPVEEHFFRGAEILVRDALKAWMER